jgi:hypothetical protein
MLLENIVLKICGAGEYGAEEDAVLESMVLRKICGVGEYGAEEDIWCWRVWC